MKVKQDSDNIQRMHARLAILRVLADAPRYTSNSSMMSNILPRLGIHYTRDQIEGELVWLEANGMLETEKMGVNLMVATANVRGIEVAQGIAHHPKIQRPGPGV